MDCQLLWEGGSGPEGKVTAAYWVNGAGIALRIEQSLDVIDPCTDCPIIATIMALVILGVVQFIVLQFCSLQFYSFVVYSFPDSLVAFKIFQMENIN